MQLKWETGAGTLEINGTEYVLKQCHWHSPSEHTINGKKFALELHMVHESQDGKAAVVGILYTIGRPDSFLSSVSSTYKSYTISLFNYFSKVYTLNHFVFHQLTDRLRLVAGTGENETIAGIVNPKEIKIGSRKYYRYMGSLTTPPCTENVIWTIVRKVCIINWQEHHIIFFSKSLNPFLLINFRWGLSPKNKWDCSGWRFTTWVLRIPCLWSYS